MLRSPVLLFASGSLFGAGLCGFLLYFLALAPALAERDHSRENYQREFEAHQITYSKYVAQKEYAEFLERRYR